MYGGNFTDGKLLGLWRGGLFLGPGAVRWAAGTIGTGRACPRRLTVEAPHTCTTPVRRRTTGCAWSAGIPIRWRTRRRRHRSWLCQRRQPRWTLPNFHWVLPYNCRVTCSRYPYRRLCPSATRTTWRDRGDRKSNTRDVRHGGVRAPLYRCFVTKTIV